MEIQKAIDILKVAQAEIEWEYPIDYACAFDTVYQYYKKFIPKDPIIKNNLNICPECGTIIIYHPNISYCDKCGQAINTKQNHN